MRRVDGPTRPSVTDYDAVVRRSNNPGKGRLEARRGQVVEQYEAYEASRGRPHLIARTNVWGVQDAGYQRRIYEHTWEDGWLQDVRSDVLAVARGSCLLCNATQPRTLDHLLPQSDFPALSIFAGNLIAACADCNRLKSNTNHDLPTTQFVHPYLEPVPRDVVFLRADVIENGVLSPQFEIVDNPEIDLELTTRLRWQFGELEIGPTYRNEAVLNFQKRQMAWAFAAENGWAALELTLRGDRRSVAHAFGVNYWESAFLQGLLDSPEFQEDPMHFLTANIVELVPVPQVAAQT